VAVLQKRGRFFTAEPLFPDRHAGDGPPRGRGPARIILTSLSARRSDGRSARAGDLVLVQRTGRGAGGRVVRVLGRPDVARDVIEALMLDRGHSREFDPELAREARQAAGSARRAEGRRRDLRDLPTFTIDPAAARDFDDAISAEPLADDSVRVWVHIADVAAHVPEGSPVDREARRRATSVYVPGTVEPMLPPALSNDACSLVPGAERPAVTVELDLRGSEIVQAEFYRSLIRSDERLEYERVDRIFAGRDSAAEPWAAALQAARHAAAALQRERERSGALVVDSEELEFTFDERGDVSGVRARVQTESHRLIEHLMIAANEAVARLLEQRGVPCLYRVHERPQPERIERLVDQLASLEVPTPPLPEPLSSSQAAELVGVISKRVDDHVRRTGRGRIALSWLVLRSLKQAHYSPKNIGHAGLHSAAYCHFTSPIRRYPDLVCHRALLSAVGGGESAPRAGELPELGAWTSERERDGMSTEREADDIARCFALERVLYEVGWEQTFPGEVTGLISAGAFIMFDNPGAGAREPGSTAMQAPTATPLYEGMLPVRRIRDSLAAQSSAGERWEINELGTTLRGERTGATLRLGEPIEVRVARVDALRGRADLAPALSATPDRRAAGRR
jgi:ribonuclease R